MLKKLAKIATLSFLIVSNILVFAGCNDNDKDYYYRVVTARDIIIEQTSTGLFTMDFIIRPQETIDDLHIYFAFFNSDEKPVIGKSKKLGNVNKGEEYTMQLSFSDDLSLKEMASISKYKNFFYGGTIKENQNIKGTCFNHDFGDGVITRNAMCSFEGEKLSSCKNCGYTKTESFYDEERHSFTLWKVIENPTSVKPGKAYYICTKCAIKEQRVIDPTLS